MEKDESIVVLDDEDDDVVITKVKVGDRVPTFSYAGLNEVYRLVQDAKELAKEAEKDMLTLRVEVDKLENDMGDAIFNGLKELVKAPGKLIRLPQSWAQLKDIVFAELEASWEQDGMWDLSQEEEKEYIMKLKSIESGNEMVSKMFLECHNKLKDIKANLLAETAAVDKELEQYEKGLLEPCMTIDSDDEDVDIQITGSTISPSKRSAPQNPLHGEGSSMPPMDELRSNFASAINKSMPTLLNNLNTSSQSSLQTQQSARHVVVGPPPMKWPELKIGDKVLGKKFNDVWYSGLITDILPAGVDGNIEWKCKVKFDGKGMKLLNGKSVAYRDHINCFIRVGTRVVALYREDDVANSFFAGVIAEAPSMKNNKRFLVFFDDGYAQYCEAKELHKVYMQSVQVWEDIDPETSAFIKEYLRIYPERPMVRLSKGQVVRTEWNGRWWTSKVIETDASLVKMYFQADKRTEWIYRGSTRLEPLFKALSNADAIKAAGSSRGRRHNVRMKPSDSERPSVEYTRGPSEDDSKSKTAQLNKQQESKKKSNVAKKSTGGAPQVNVDHDDSSKGKWEAPWTKYQRKATKTDGESKEAKNPASYRSGSAKELSSKDIASVLQERLAVEYDEEKVTGERKELKLNESTKVAFKHHKCGPQCVSESDSKRLQYKGRPILLLPLLCGWERQICKARPSHKRFVIYRAPCGRRLRSIENTDHFLSITDSQFSIDSFCFDVNLHVNSEFVPYIPVKTFCDIKDLSYGIENFPVSCVNGVDRLFPDYVEYANKRMPSKGVHINTDPGFLACCDCTDNCRDRSKCACQQLTIENTTWVGDRDEEAGYYHKRLKEPSFTGIVECNSGCKCDDRCANRVAQHGLQMRLQVFKTEKKGWGLRCLDDIAKGSFICIYAGQLLTDRGANEDGKQYGDEYLAELDFIEVVEGQKEGYESDVEMSDEEKKDEDESKDSDDDSDYNENVMNDANYGERRRSKRNTTKEDQEKKDKNPQDTTQKKNDNNKDAVEKSNQNDVSENEDESNTNGKGDEQTGKKKPRAKKSTGGSRFNLSTSLSQGQEPIPDKIEKSKHVPTRSYFKDDSDCYIMDAKSMGNLGRYLNHSCTPNVFVQNIFVDTHDLRFPWVAFFAGQYIRAGTELTWDYNYEVGSVPDKIMYCYCGSSMCRGRLL